MICKTNVIFLFLKCRDWIVITSAITRTTLSLWKDLWRGRKGRFQNQRRVFSIGFVVTNERTFQITSWNYIYNKLLKRCSWYQQFFLVYYCDFRTMSLSRILFLGFIYSITMSSRLYFLWLTKYIYIYINSWKLVG